jgi:hypothetical protein
MQVFKLDESMYQVSSARDPSKLYEVEIDPRMATCTCPHYVFRCRKAGLPCKHIIAVLNAREA